METKPELITCPICYGIGGIHKYNEEKGHYVERCWLCNGVRKISNADPNVKAKFEFKKEEEEKNGKGNEEN